MSYIRPKRHCHNLTPKGRSDRMGHTTLVAQMAVRSVKPTLRWASESLRGHNRGYAARIARIRLLDTGQPGGGGDLMELYSTK